MTDLHATGRVRLARDSQQWEFDRAIKDTGRVFHFQPEGRGGLPRAVRSHRMISKHLGRGAQRLERLAREELEAGHPEAAHDYFFDAASAYGQAQHTIFAIDEEKQLLHSSALRCYDEMRALAPYAIEHVDVPFEGSSVSGNLHLCPGEGVRPCILYIPGCDMTKEMYPHPRFNHAHHRGLHILSFDGPGQGESNLRGVKLTPDNYERAAVQTISYLLDRPEVSDVVVYGQSFGSFWAVRTAALDRRVRALAAPWMSGCDRYHLMTEESPRFKQLFAHLTRAASEAELDELMAGYTNHGDMERVACPTLLAVGEYDPRSPLEEVYELYDALTAPKELWVFADQHHMLSLTGNAQGVLWLNDSFTLAIDWLRDRLNGRPLAHDGDVVRIEAGGGSPNGSAPVGPRWWFE
ncbi:MAG: hypothetical protein V7607_5927 [Solirubrobacteraceae bacterium]